MTEENKEELGVTNEGRKLLRALRYAQEECDKANSQLQTLRTAQDEALRAVGDWLVPKKGHAKNTYCLAVGCSFLHVSVSKTHNDGSRTYRSSWTGTLPSSNTL